MVLASTFLLPRRHALKSIATDGAALLSEAALGGAVTGLGVVRLAQLLGGGWAPVVVKGRRWHVRSLCREALVPATRSLATLLASAALIIIGAVLTFHLPRPITGELHDSWVRAGAWSQRRF